ncbi:MAG: hypothetical protein ACMUHM_01730 [Thermoplasmatota archaeon]
MYCIVKCPFCKNLQGGVYPVKTTRCQVCSKRIDLHRTGLIGVYDDLKEMQGNLMAKKWEGGDEEDLIEVVQTTGEPVERKKRLHGRDGIRKAILQKLETDLPRNALIEEIVREGHDKDTVEEVLEELIEKGLVHYPRYSLLRKS